MSQGSRAALVRMVAAMGVNPDHILDGSLRIEPWGVDEYRISWDGCGLISREDMIRALADDTNQQNRSE